MRGEMERYPQGGVETIEVPDVITKDWLADLTDYYGWGCYEVELKAEDWLVQGPYYKDRFSTEFKLNDIPGPDSPYTIRGKLWCAAEAETTRYTDSTRIPAVYLHNARVVWQSGKEQPIADDRNGQLTTELVMAPPEKRLVLVRLDRLKGDPPASLKLTAVGSAEAA